MGQMFLQILDMGEGSVKEVAIYFAMFYRLGIEFSVSIGTKLSIKYMTSQYVSIDVSGYAGMYEACCLMKIAAIVPWWTAPTVWRQMCWNSSGK